MYLRTLFTLVLVKEYEDHVSSADFSLEVPGPEDHHVLVVHVGVPGLGEVPGIHRRELHLHIMGELRAPGDSVNVHKGVTGHLDRCLERYD